jgi:hypothetical protein
MRKLASAAPEIAQITKTRTTIQAIEEGRGSSRPNTIEVANARAIGASSRTGRMTTASARCAVRLRFALAAREDAGVAGIREPPDNRCVVSTSCEVLGGGSARPGSDDMSSV